MLVQADRVIGMMQERPTVDTHLYQYTCTRRAHLFSCCRQVSTEEGEDKAKQENIMFIETSAKVGWG